MNKERYEELKNGLPTTLRVKLERISRYLSQNMASVMVGAGFSLNAKQLNPAARMMKWSDLVKTFWELLYPGVPMNMELTTPMHLASLLEAQSGRSELDNQIANSLPDNTLEPGDLHIALMKLPWKDVFTTNYDRLLERAGEKTGRNYNLVTNRSTLIYTQSPRVVKLHGSFPDIRPFIMTEDDFRTYPDKYPEFVNTVRQALIENVFCLVGFSGEDPNFLSWLGWLRDVMGEWMSPVYLIDYKENIQDADIKLNNFRKVDVVNLYEIPTIKGITEALTFFFSYLQENMEEQKEWIADLGLRPFETKSLQEVTQQMREIRQGYQGWLFLPERYMGQFGELTDYFPYLGEKIDKLTTSEQISFLFELDWRLRKTGSPYTLGWYLEKLESLDLQAANGDEFRQILQLKLSLLSAYRTILEREKFDNLEQALDSYYTSHEDNTKGQFNYERCLMGIVRGQWDKVRAVLNDWTVADTNYQDLLWKANILAIIGKEDRSIALLDTVRNKVGVALLNSTKNREFLHSCAHLANLTLRYYTPKVDVKSIDLHRQDGADFDNLLYRLQLESEQQKPKTGTYDEHGYLLKEVNTVWRSEDRGFYKDYANAYRILAQIDKTGQPLQVNGRPIRNQLMEQTLTTMTRYDSGIVISTIVRMSGDRFIQRSVFTRELSRYIKVSEAQLFYKEWIEACKRVAQGKEKDDAKSKLVRETIIPILMMMSVKLTQDELKELLKLYLSLYEAKDTNYQAKLLNLLYSCMTKDTLKQVMPLIYKTDLVDYGRMMDSHLVLPSRGYDGFKIDAVMMKLMKDGFGSDSNALHQEAFVRLESLINNIGAGWIDKVLRDEIVAWRNKGVIWVLQRRSYQLLPPKGKDDKLRYEQLLEYDVTNLLNTIFDKKNYTATLGTFRSKLEMLSYHPMLGSEQSDAIVEKVTQFLQTYEKQILGVERGVDFSSDYQFTEYFFVILRNMLAEKHLQGMSVTKVQLLLDELNKFTKKFDVEYTVAMLIAMLNPKPNEVSQFAVVIEENLFSGQRAKRQDTMRALLEYAHCGADMTDIVKHVVQYIKTTLNDNICEYVDFLTKLEGMGLLFVDEELMTTMSYLLVRLDDEGLKVSTRMDVAFSGVILTAKMAKRDRKAQKLHHAWKKYVEEPEMFNDVKVALES